MRLLRLTQEFPRPRLHDIPGAVHAELHRQFGSMDLRGRSISLLLSSRGIASYAEIVAATGSYFLQRGMRVRGVPAMGSHAGATPEGQLGILQQCGITQASMGFPLYGDMDTVQWGTLGDGTPVRVAWRAEETDFMFAINRSKPHTQIRGRPFGSGCPKMYCIGVGKLDGPSVYHSLVTEDRPLDRVVEEVLAVVLANPKVLGGLSIVENAYHEVAAVGALGRTTLLDQEAAMYAQACSYMPSLPLMKIGVLVIGEISKKHSGAGMDPNVTGRWRPGIPVLPGDPAVTHIAVMNRRGDNFIGVGFADSCNIRVFAGVDPHESELNARTGGCAQLAVPPAIQTYCDRELLERALAAAGTELPLVYMHTTLNCHELFVSDHGKRVWRDSASATFGDAVEVTFDDNGNILTPTFAEH